MNNGRGFGGGSGRGKGRDTGGGGGRGMAGGRGCGRSKGFRTGAQVGSAVAISSVPPANPQVGLPTSLARGGSRLVAVVDDDRCTGCGICITFCPSQAISVASLAAIDTMRCTGCGEGIAICSARALSVAQRVRSKRSAAG